MPSPDVASAKESRISWRGELARKSIHLCSLVIPLAFYILNQKVIIIGLSAAFIFMATFDLLRLFGNITVKKYFRWLFGFMLRPRERKSFSGATTILFAALLVYIFYDLRIAAASMVIIVMGDTAAAFIGRLIGRVRLINNKTIEGTTAFIIASLVGLFFIPKLGFQLGLIGALVGALFEVLPIPIDDNVTVPLLAGAAMQLMVSYQLFI